MADCKAAAEHARVYAAIEALDRSGSERGSPIALVFVVARDNPAPDAHWRRRFAEQRSAFRSPSIFLSIVTQSSIMRGVLTAMNWIAPQPPRMTSATHATFEECAEWIERLQGTPRKVLLRLRDEVTSSAVGSPRPSPTPRLG